MNTVAGKFYRWEEEFVSQTGNRSLASFAILHITLSQLVFIYGKKKQKINFYHLNWKHFRCSNYQKYYKLGFFQYMIDVSHNTMTKDNLWLVNSRT